MVENWKMNMEIPKKRVMVTEGGRPEMEAQLGGGGISMYVVTYVYSVVLLDHQSSQIVSFCLLLLQKVKQNLHTHTHTHTRTGCHRVSPLPQPGEVGALRAPHGRRAQADHDGGRDEGVELGVELGSDVHRVALHAVIRHAHGT